MVADIDKHLGKFRSSHCEIEIDLIIEPDGPILVKGNSNEADPSLPNMSFVRTTVAGNETVYLPGSSLKGVLRAHSEKLARTAEASLKRSGRLLACDPVAQKPSAERGTPDYQCSKALNEQADRGPVSADEAFDQSCVTCQIFGNQFIASHIRVADAYPLSQTELEERNGVAIDRVFGSVAHGPFNYETAVSGQFTTRIALRNLPLAFAGLVFITLNDFAEGRVRLGFGKSRGLGAVKAKINGFAVRYAVLQYADDKDKLVDMSGAERDTGTLYGVASLQRSGGLNEDEVAIAGKYTADGWLGARCTLPVDTEGRVAWEPVGRSCAELWSAYVRSGVEAKA